MLFVELFGGVGGWRYSKKRKKAESLPTQAVWGQDFGLPAKHTRNAALCPSQGDATSTPPPPISPPEYYTAVSRAITKLQYRTAPASTGLPSGHVTVNRRRRRSRVWGYPAAEDRERRASAEIILLYLPSPPLPSPTLGSSPPELKLTVGEEKVSYAAKATAA